MIVSNTTPISNLLQLDLLCLIKDLCEAVTIPRAVAKELDEGVDVFGQWREKCGELLQIHSVLPDPLIQQFLISLHPGEAEALTLAIRHHARLFLCDDLDARKLAGIHGLRVSGTLGLLVKGKSTGLINAVTPYLDRLRNDVQFWFTDALYIDIVKLCGESCL